MIQQKLHAGAAAQQPMHFEAMLPAAIGGFPPQPHAAVSGVMHVSHSAPELNLAQIPLLQAMPVLLSAAQQNPSQIGMVTEQVDQLAFYLFFSLSRFFRVTVSCLEMSVCPL